MPSYPTTQWCAFYDVVGPDVQIPLATGQVSLSYAKTSGAVPPFPLASKATSKRNDASGEVPSL